MELTVEQFGELPDFMKEQFEEHDGKYQSIDSLKLQKVKSTADSLDSRAREFESKYKELETRLNGYEAQKAEDIKKARDEALEKATSNGEVERIKELYEQKMADLEQRSYERGKLEASNEFKQQSLANEAKTMRATLAAKLAIDSESQEAIELLLESMIKPSDDGIGLFDSKGSALSITDVNEFEKEVVKKSALFKRLIKPDVVVSGGGLADGGASSGHKGKDAEYMSRLKSAGLI